jgi:hypothetical protein
MATKPAANDAAKIRMFESAWFGQGDAFWRWVDTAEAEPYVAAFNDMMRPLPPGEPLDLLGPDDDTGDILDTTDFARLATEIEAKYGSASGGDP